MSFFTDYAGELALLAAEPDPLPALLSRHGPGPWRRTYARCHPQQPSYCSFLYESSEGVLPLRVSLFRDADAAPRGEALAGLGVARVSLPTEDEALDTLHTALARYPGAAIVRYRPEHRCTFRAAHPQGRAQYVKVFPSGLTPRMHEATQLLWQRRAELGFAVAEPLEFDGELRFAAQAALPGTPLLKELLGSRGLEVAAALGRAAATLPQSSMTGAGLEAIYDPLANTEYQAGLIAALLPEYADRVWALVSRLRSQEAACARARRLAIHGALHPAQWLRLDDGGLGLVDFDGLGLGDPEFDVATFVTELRYSKAATPMVALCDAFTSAYAERVPLDARRVALYVVHKETAKLLRLARAPRPDAPARFARALQQLEQAAQP